MDFTPHQQERIIGRRVADEFGSHDVLPYLMFCESGIQLDVRTHWFSSPRSEALFQVPMILFNSLDLKFVVVVGKPIQSEPSGWEPNVFS
jgi:hypothetical protein